MKFFKSLLVCFAFAGCGPRIINHNFGSGPQGGPENQGQKRPGQNAPLQSVSLLPNDFDGQLGEWRFQLNIGVHGWNFESRIYLNESKGQIDSNWTTGSSAGSFYCSGPTVAASVAACREMHILVHPFWEDGTFQPSGAQTLHFVGKRQLGCALRGQFDSESESTLWAKGYVESLYLSEVLPTIMDDGTVISALADHHIKFHVDKFGAYSTKILFNVPNQKKRVTATLEYSCLDGPEGVARDLR